jgi:flagellar biosynthetic protein FlhB
MSDLTRQFDLQLFAGEKTEPATPKRKQDARKKGQVVRSAELNSALVLLAGILAVYLLLPAPGWQFSRYAAATWQQLLHQDLDIPATSQLFWQVCLQAGLVLLPVLGVVFLASWISSLGQVGFLLAGKPLSPSLGRLNPLEGIKRMFSKRSLVELLKSLFKLLGIGYLVYQSANDALNWAYNFISTDINASFAALVDLIYRTSLKVAAFLLLLGAADYVYQRYEFNQNLRMSKQEVKEEMKQSEGDPQIKARIRERQRLLARRRMMQDVPKADVVIVNPTHLAIALKYEQGKADAPIVLAKGRDYLAQKIKDIARLHRISVVEDKPLAQALFKAVEVGEVIPSEFYQAVAEILAFIFRTRQKRSG